MAGVRMWSYADQNAECRAVADAGDGCRLVEEVVLQEGYKCVIR